MKVPVTHRGATQHGALDTFEFRFIDRNLSVMCPGLDPALVVARQLDPGRSTKVDKVADEFLLCGGEQDLDIQSLTLGLGLDCEGRKEVRTINRDFDGVMEGRTDDLWWGDILVCVQEVDICNDFSRF